MWAKPEWQQDHEETLRNIASEQHRDRVFLEHERIFAGAWPYVADSEDPKIQAMLPEFQSLVKCGVETMWGPCDFEFDSKNKTIKVFAKDGRGMELISGAAITRE